ncbi:hypothetical protein EPVG_00040 [Emiliania huxleyi virus 201]|nr:hypothetical protein ELVG_00209 [Emiliania huxleyi virus 203]AEP15586.1 hypothetical protein EQVG_00176 [Emiliania huxleyi virus 207]AEP16028.1 hypothetical protein ERVG_00151 [Emiliania huxleyi virus 208]AET97928.1 hypothetical protein EPVG_00040 [Emiliania huxleyi virus 201]
MSGIIYYIQSPSGKGYIGQTDNFERRMKDHQKKSSNCTLLKRAINKYGWSNMKITILLKCSVDDMGHYEQLMVNTYDTFAPNGYNCTSGGEEYKQISEYTKYNISNALYNHNKHNICHNTGILLNNSSTFGVQIPGSWTNSKKRRKFFGFTTQEAALEFKNAYYEKYVQNQETIIEESTDEVYNAIANIKRKHIRKPNTGRIFKQHSGSKNYTTVIPKHAQKYYQQKSYKFPTYKEAEDFLETCTTCFITEENNSYKFTVPPPWLASPDAQKTYTGFKTRQEAQLFMDNFYIIYVEGYDKPLPCVTSSVPNSQMPYNPYFIF